MINNVTEAVSALKNSINQAIPDLKVVENFPADAADYPMQRSALVVGIKSAKIPSAGCFYLGEDSKNNTYYGTVAEIEFSLKICMPKTQNGAECYPIFDKIMYACTRCECFSMLEFKVGKMEYHRLMGAVTLDTEIKASVPFATLVTSGIGEVEG